MVLTVACAIGISHALITSGISNHIADLIIGVTKSLGPVAVMSLIYIATAILATFITNVAAATIVFPIAYVTATHLGVDPRAFVITVIVAASASFATPIYQTNLIVQGPGGYRFKDYLKTGLPLNVIFLMVAIYLIPRIWQF
mgnify:CR=1 FL=1